MILQTLFDLVNELRQRIETHGPQLRSNEMQTRYALIDPLLRELGWDTSDPSVVTPEYSVGGGSADYALLRDGKPVMMVEAKRLGYDLQSALSQGIGYCVEQGTPYFALSDGRRWEVFETFRAVPIEERKLVSFDVSIDAPGTICLKALALWRPTVEEGRVREGQEPIFRQDDETKDPECSVDDGKGGVEWTSLSLVDESNLRKNEDGRTVQPVGVGFPDGSSHEVRYWWEVTASFAEWLIDKGALSKADCPISLWQGHVCVIAASPNHPSGAEMTRAKPVRTLYMEANFSAADHVWIAKKLIQRMGRDPSKFKLRFP